MHKKKNYALDKCALYKLGSKKRLASVLLVPLKKLMRLAKSGYNYRYFELPEEHCPYTGRVRRARKVQEPKKYLRAIHSRILNLLRPISLAHYAHAAIKGRSYRTNAEVHISSICVANFDVNKFYPSTTKSRVFNFFLERLQCVPDVAHLLSELVCCGDSLPTGSPLSPLLSMHVNSPMFEALHSIAEEHELTFSCYVDDITFSGNKLPSGLTGFVKRVVNQHGHSLSDAKTKYFMHNQDKHVTGIVISEGKLKVPNWRFKKFRGLKKALSLEEDSSRRLVLARKVAGLLGEAAFIDARYKDWAKVAYRELRDNQVVDG